MSKIFDAMAGTGGFLKLISIFTVWGFLIWSIYFTGDYEFGILRGILAFFIIGIFIGFVSMIPFGLSFAPIIFEWWWHDISFWDFSTAAWIVTGVSMVANILFVTGLYGASRNQDNY